MRVVPKKATPPPRGLSTTVSPMFSSCPSKGMMSHEAVTHSGSRGDTASWKSVRRITSSWEKA